MVDSESTLSITMFDSRSDVARHEALTAVVRGILQLQKRQVELYEAQLSILSDFPPTETPRAKDVLHENNPRAALMLGRPAAACMGSRIVCESLPTRHMDMACKEPDEELDTEPRDQIRNPGSRSRLSSRSSSYRFSVNESHHEKMFNVRNWNGKRVSEFIEDAIWLGGMDSLSPAMYGDFPSEIPAVTRRTLFFLGAVPSDACARGPSRKLYQAYRLLILVSFAVTGLWLLTMACLHCWAGFFPVELVYCFVISVICPVMIIQLWRELGTRGAYMDMMHQMSSRNFDFKSLDDTARYLWGLILLLSVASFAGYVVMWSHGKLIWRAKDSPITEHPSIIQILHTMVSTAVKFLSPLLPFHGALAMGMIWGCVGISELHRQDLLNYGLVLTKVLEGDECCDHLLMLKDLELTTTARLRHADRTWVQRCMSCICVLILVSVVVGSYLIISDSATGTFFAILYLIAACTGTGVITKSMATVAETYGQDVFKTLNNPLLIKKSQEYFGQQFLSHLIGHKWGFRFHGERITAKFSFRLLIALITPATLAISQACIAIFVKPHQTY